jgi:hypothetical protein
MSKQYSFHSIRHNVATNFQRAKVEESISARLGWTLNSRSNYDLWLLL